MSTARDPEMFVFAFMGLGLLVLGGFLVARLRRTRAAVPMPEPSSHRAPSEPVRAEEAAPCKCGAWATRPAPEVIPRATWWDVVRRNVGLPPRYTLRIPEEAPSIYCDVHGRVADTLTDEELAIAVVVERKKAESAIVKRVAGFITSTKSGLERRVFESMTDDQQADHKARTRPAKVAEVVPIGRAANDRGEA